jgi:hypothetical protein
MVKIKTVEVHYVEFMSPGTLFSETSVRKIASWDAKKACTMAKKIEERHGASPYGFRFFTMREAGPVKTDAGDMKVEPQKVRQSGIYFITGTVRTAKEVLAGADPEEKILRSNVEINRIPAVIENCNSYKSTLPFEKDDVVVDWAGKVVLRGSAVA